MEVDQSTPGKVIKRQIRKADVSLTNPSAIVWEYNSLAVVAKIRAYKANLPCTQRV